MSCILRVWGDFDVTAFLAGTNLTPHHVWREGEPQRFPDRIARDSGFLLAASPADFCQPEQQIEDVIAFLQTHHASLLTLNELLTVTDPEWDHTYAELDFGIEDRVGTLNEWGHEIVHQGDRFPPILIRLAGQLGLGLTVSRYPRTPPEDGEA
ncbi:hypothetical protein [Deinococcus multiflagellatus]|uniref:Uncharacterized protein n=1 Tax=Deinococcus multiflagellatus TaxID=1656887 RepID=A0ABW1ZJZ0_9DEIO|nr:hypothetical protein [Deinococcus multiflagellatus]MBZ9713144.1 hypothetical protein [Deinococcus multiflagellatus]